ncbi:MAG: efflux RND transporter periplasmic adaptor subunit [Helicobacteraceae bacterium]|jgi:macrolide-specific efflux system membrane fusion protein|nr:efflux RND transporter periplasmic adaptor subunit [Helicobacteraceae bacterium]
MKKKILFAALLAAVPIAYFALADSRGGMRYVTERARIGDVKKTINAIGEIGAVKLVSVGAQVSGQIETIEVKIGDAVKKGDVIATIDSTAQRNEVAVIAAKLDSCKAQMQSSQIALTIAERKHERTKALFGKNAVSRQEAEEAQNEYETAKSKAAENASLVKQTEISLESAKKNLAYATITAPLDGTIVSLPVKIGQTLNASLDTPVIAQIADLSAVEILIEVSEGDILHIKEGQKAAFSILSEERVYEATIKSVDPALTSLTNNQYNAAADSNQAIYYYARIEHPNEGGKFRIGMTTQNTIEIESAQNVLMIPASAISERGGRKLVKIIDGKNSVEKEITTGLSDGAYIEVKSGLSEGDEVIISQMTVKEIEAKADEVPEGVDAL